MTYTKKFKTLHHHTIVSTYSNELLEFWESLPTSLKALIRYRVARISGREVEEIMRYSPHRVYKVLSDALGGHNADLIIYMFYKWLLKRGRRVNLGEVSKFLGKTESEAI